MKINSSSIQAQYANLSKTYEVKQDEKIDAKKISEAYFAQYQFKVNQESQNSVFSQVETFSLADIGYEGKAIGKLTQEEAKELVSENGFFGVSQTSMRIADFVLSGASEDVAKLKAGRSGILQGFEQAENLWGGKLPEISYETIQKALEKIDEKLFSLGANVLEQNA